MHSDEITIALARLERSLNRLVDTQTRLAVSMETAATDTLKGYELFETTVLERNVDRPFPPILGADK